MKSKQLLLTIISAVFFLLFPEMAGADAVPWTTQTYTAYTWAGDCCPSLSPWGIDSETNQTPPVSAYSGSSLPSTWAYSEMTSSSMTVQTSAFGLRAIAWTEFQGTYQASQPFFAFTYDFSGFTQYWDMWDNPAPVPDSMPPKLYIDINDLTDGTILYSNNLYPGSDVVTVFTAAEHDISVSFGLRYSYPLENSTTDYTANYNMAIVPEPISSVLLVTGGSLLAGRRYIKRKKKAQQFHGQ